MSSNVSSVEGAKIILILLCKNGLKPETFIEIEVVLEQRDIVLYYLFDNMFKTSLTLHHGLWAKENRDNHISKSITCMKTGVTKVHCQGFLFGIRECRQLK